MPRRFAHLRALCRGLLAVLPVLARAGDAVIEADEVLVTAPSASGTLRAAPHSVTIITPEDIARAGVTTIGALLSQEANLNLQSYFGGDRQATIDIRGMGATATSNVLVLVDGVRLNENDLSGADLSSIGLAQVERIEILRGGGAVRYGNGAVGGVINIITRRPQPGAPALGILARRESYDTSEFRVNAGGAAGPLAASVNVSRFDTDGYRRNGAVAAHDASAELRLLPPGRLDFLDLYARVVQHHDVSGLPGPVSAQAFQGGSDARRATNAPGDNSVTDDRRYTLGANADIGATGRVLLQAGYRDRENPFVIGFDPARDRSQQQSLIASTRRDLTARVDQDVTAFGWTHSLSVGADWQSADYSRSENGQYVLDSSTRRLGSVESSGAFGSAIVRGPYGLSLNAGLRIDRFETAERDERFTRGGCTTVSQTVLIDVDPGPGVSLVPVVVQSQTGCTNAYRVQAQQGGAWRNQSTELGVTWQPTPGFTAFTGVTRHFRNPNVDELLLAAADLRPQTGRTIEAGMRGVWRDRAEWSVTAFRMDIDDEIYFGRDPVIGLGLNRNYELPTRRTGAEAELRWRISGRTTLRANLAYVVPRFDGVDADVPLVPRFTASAGIEHAWSEAVRGSFAVRHVGRRFDGNDFANDRFPALPSYAVCDAVLRFERGGAQLSVGVSNLFNEVYSTVAFSGTYYPMPERTFYVALRWKL